MDALTGEYLPIANSTNLLEKTYYADGQKPQKTSAQTEDEPVKLNISAEAQNLLTQTEGEFLPPSATDEAEDGENTDEETENSEEESLTEEKAAPPPPPPPPPPKEEEEEEEETDTESTTTDAVSALIETDEEDEEEIAKLEEQDVEVKAEQTKQLAAVGQYATGISYEYEIGPDGEMYAADSKVNVDTSSIEGDPEATLLKARALKTAMSGGELSPEEAAILQQASQIESEALAEIAAENSKASESASKVADTYGLMESVQTTTFSISA